MADSYTIKMREVTVCVSREVMKELISRAKAQMDEPGCPSCGYVKPLLEGATLVVHNLQAVEFSQEVTHADIDLPLHIPIGTKWEISAVGAKAELVMKPTEEESSD